MADKGTISLETIWTEAELLVMHVCVVQRRPHAEAAKMLRISERTVGRLITSAFEAARECVEYGYEVNLDNSDFVCPEIP